MKKLTFILGILFVVFLIISSCTSEPKNVSNEIKEANKVFMEAFNSGNANALAMNYTTNAKLYPSNSNIIEGQEAIEGFWNGAMHMGIKKVILETVSAKGYGNFAVEEGSYKLYVEGDYMVDQGKYIVTWEKVNGQWKLDRDIWNTNNPAPPTRANLNDTVWIVLNRIKADKVSQFEDFNFNYLEPAAAEYYPNMRNTVRTLRPVEQDKNGIFSYFYLMDPAISPIGYDMMIPLTAKYGEEKANEYLKMFNDCLKDGKQELIVTIQTVW